MTKRRDQQQTGENRLRRRTISGRRPTAWKASVFCLEWISYPSWLSFKNRFKIQPVFFKENVRYPIWICRDPISLILGTRW